jgi:GR25 family glycosyltransferase involved in LPS biosynthesis
MKAFIIYLPEREHSVSHSQYMLETLQNYGIDSELFEGIPGDQAVQLAAKAKKTLYPYSIKNRVLDDKDIKQLIRPELYEDFKQRYRYNIVERQPIGEAHIGKLSRPGVVGCFYSHYALWQKCVDLGEPIMIFEDDVKFYRGWNPVDWDGVLILSLGKSSFMTEPQKTYLENPTGVPKAMPWQNFSMPGASGYAIKPDAALGLVKFYKPYWYPADNAINQFITPMNIHNYIMGRNTLAEEGNVSMTKSKDWAKKQKQEIRNEDYQDLVNTASTSINTDEGQ